MLWIILEIKVTRTQKNGAIANVLDIFANASNIQFREYIQSENELFTDMFVDYYVPGKLRNSASR